MLCAFGQHLRTGRGLALCQTQRQFQRSLCGAGADERTVRARDEQFFHIHLVSPGSAQIHRAHRPDGIAAAGARQTGNADRDIRTGGFCRAQRHLRRHGSRHHIILRNDRRVHPDKLRLGLLPVGHKAVAKHLACAGHTGQALGDHAAGAAFRSGNGQAVGLQRMHHRLF